MIKKILTIAFSTALVLAPTYSFARQGADDPAGHDANEHAGGHEQNHGGANSGSSHEHGNHGGTTTPGTSNRGHKHGADDAAGHDVNDNDADDHLPPPAPAPL